LRDTTAAVVADQINLVDLQRVQKFPQHVCVSRDRHVLVRRDVGFAMRQQINRDAPADIRESGQLVPP